MHMAPLNSPTPQLPYTNATIVLEFITQQFLTQVARQRPIHDFDHAGSFCACHYAGHSNARGAFQHEPVPIVRGWTSEGHACVVRRVRGTRDANGAHDEGNGSAAPPMALVVSLESDPTTCIHEI